MTLKAFDEVNVSTKTSYTVFKDGKCVDLFTVDYGENVRKDNVLKEVALRDSGAKVRFISVNSVTGVLEVSVDIKD